MSDDNKPGCLEVIGVMCLSILFETITDLYKAWVLSWLWAWFINGTLCEFNLTWLQIFGILIFVDLVKINLSQTVKDAPSDWGDLMTHVFYVRFLSVIGSTTSLVLGYIFYKLFF